MRSILYVGMDVHKSNFTLCSYDYHHETFTESFTMNPEALRIREFVDSIKHNYMREFNTNKCDILCGYEAGSLGYSLYHQLTRMGIKCVILAPTTMPKKRKKGIKNDKRDAKTIAQCLAHNTYSAVHIPDDEDDAVKEYIRMRDDIKIAFKRIKQQILAFCIRHGKRFTDGRNNWTKKHLKWLEELKLGNAILDETLAEYMITYYQLSNKIDMYDARIEEIAKEERYYEDVRKLSCLIGINTHTALATLVEVVDFKRFAKAENFAAYLGLVPGENSSGDRVRVTGITKAGNSHIRRLLIEAAQCYPRGRTGHISRDLSKRQTGNNPKVIAYANKANERLRRKAFRLNKTKKTTIVAVAVARELACFIWGLMTDNTA